MDQHNGKILPTYKEPREACTETYDSSSILSVVRPGYNGKKRCNIVQFSATSVFDGVPKQSMQLLEKYHLTYKFIKTECKLVRRILNTFGFSETNPGSSYYNLMWSGCHVKAFDYKALEPHQKTNHFPRSFELTRKDRLYKNIQTMQQTKGVKAFGFIPKNFILPSEYDAFHAEFMKDRGFWIVKPVASSRGRGIYLINDIRQVPTNEQLLVCKYIDSPLLIDGFKFDCRIYVAVTCFDPLTIYIYEEGLTRFSTVLYNNAPSSIKNLCMHLTNYSINKYSKDYVRCEHPEIEDYGNKWSFSALLIYLRKLGKDTEALLADIEDVIIKTLLSAESAIASAYNLFVSTRGNCFELFGFDILIDSNMKPWLLEVNLSPSLACDSPLDLKIKSNLMVDLFNLTGFVLRDPIDKRPSRTSRASPSLSKHVRSSSVGRLNTSSTMSLSVGMEYSIEDKQMLRDTKEEYRNRGRFVRVYPSPESWRKYGHIHTHCSTKNKALHVMLFPELWQSAPSKTLAMEYNRSNHSATSRSFLRNIHPVYCVNKTLEHSKNGLTFAQRFKCYERKLLSAPNDSNETMNPCTASSSFSRYDLRTPNNIIRRDVNNNDVDFNSPEIKSATAPINLKSSPTSEQCRRHVAAHVNSLTPYEARMTFATYLQRVQHRLLQQSPSSHANEALSKEDVIKHAQQIELVHHFLNKASENLNSDSIQKNTSTADLHIHERRRILARQLRQFLSYYTKQTEELYKSKINTRDSRISNRQFQVFVATASEGELESVLTAFTRNKNASDVFFGSTKNKNRKSEPDYQPDDERNTNLKRPTSKPSVGSFQQKSGHITRRSLSASRVDQTKRNAIRKSAFSPILPPHASPKSKDSLPRDASVDRLQLASRPVKITVPLQDCYFVQRNDTTSVLHDVCPRPPVKPKPCTPSTSKRHFYKQCVPSENYNRT